MINYNINHQLQSRGEYIQHLMVILFKGYEAATAKEFVSYNCLNKYEYDEGGYIDADKLPYHIENQNMEMIRAKDWHTPPKENQEILALLKEQYLKIEGGIDPGNFIRAGMDGRK